MDKLTKKQIIFANHYIDGCSGAEAYRLAYGEHLSHNVSKSAAWRHLENPKIKDYIKAREDSLYKKYELTKEIRKT